MSGDIDFETYPHGTKKALDEEVAMLHGELETQAQNSVLTIANLIEHNRKLGEALLPFAMAHTREDPYHEVTLDHLRTAHDTLHGK